MNSEGVALLTKKKYYLILSVKTKQAYIDKNGAGYLFAIKKEALDFAGSMQPKVYVSETSKNITQNKDIKSFVCLGMRTLLIKRRDKDSPDKIELGKGDIKRGYYNTDLEFNITRLRETSLLKYLLDMKKNTFLVPVYLQERKSKEYPKLFYCHAIFSDKKEAIVAFSMMEEFNDWNKDQIKNKGREFFPLEVSATRLLKAANGADVIINPLSDKLYLKDSQLRM